jgi:fimbrial chaperone protein
MVRYLLIFNLLFSSSLAFASFEFAPIIANIAPAGAASSASFTVTNPGDTKIPVQVTLVAREPDVEGKEDYKETDEVSDMFRIFPGQVILNPKETRTIRVSYVGTPKVKKELAFRIIAEELPVDVSDPNKVYKTAVAHVTIATKYVGSLYVTPAGAKPEITVEAKYDETLGAKEDPKSKNKKDDKAKKDAKKDLKKDGPAKNMLVTVSNIGSAHMVVQKPILKLQPINGGTEVVLQGTDVQDLGSLNVLAGKVRKIALVWPKDLPIGPVKASIEIPKQ